MLAPVFEASVVRYPADRPDSERDLLGCIRSVIPWDHPCMIVAKSSAGPLALKFVEAQRQNIRAVALCGAFVTNPLAVSTCQRSAEMGHFVPHEIVAGKDTNTSNPP